MNSHVHDEIELKHEFSHAQSIRAQALKVARIVLASMVPITSGRADDLIKVAMYIVGDQVEEELTDIISVDGQELGHWVPAPDCTEEHEFGAEGWRPTITDIHEHWVSLSDEIHKED